MSLETRDLLHSFIAALLPQLQRQTSLFSAAPVGFFPWIPARIDPEWPEFSGFWAIKLPLDLKKRPGGGPSLRSSHNAAGSHAHDAPAVLTDTHWHSEHCAGVRPVSARGVAQGLIGVARRVREVQEMNAHHRFAASNPRAAEL